MKIKDKFLSAVVLTAAALCASCSTDDIASQQQAETKAASLTATLDDSQTRAGINNRSGNTHTLYWHEDDAILVQTKTAEGGYSGTKFDIAAGTETGATSATFSGQVGINEIGSYAVYPYNADHKFSEDGKSLTYNLPAKYSYSKVESGIFPKDGAYRTTNTCVPMLGKIKGDKASFQHLGGLAVIRIDKMPTASGEIVVSSDHQLCGDFTVDLSADNPEIAAPTINSTVTFKYSNATKGGVGVFYLPLPTGSYSNLNVTVEDVSGTAITATYGSLNVERGDLIAIPVYQGTDGISYSCTYEVNDHKFIDLGLPSGTLWAETNVGAASAADDGCYFAWGETEPKNSYSWDNYKFASSDYSMSKYNDANGKTVLDKEDDAAYVNWGAYCRMPTRDEFAELRDYCTSEWTNMSTSGGTSINGYKVCSKKNGNSIFLPASGYDNYQEGPLSSHGNLGYYWSSTFDGYGYARILSFYNGSFFGSATLCSYGLTVRPVAKTYSTLSNESVPDMTTSGFDATWE